MKKLFRFATLSALCLAPMMAQRPFADRGAADDPATRVQRRVAFLTKMLDLTTTQAAQATTIYTNAATAAVPLHTSLDQARQSMRDAVKANNTATIDQLSANIGTLTGQAMAIENKAEAAFYAILTPDQRTKLDQLGPGGFRGRGGPWPGGPGPEGRRPQ